jgi:hypothetical protein
VLLPYYFVKNSRPHPVGKWLFAVFSAFNGEQIIHHDFLAAQQRFNYFWQTPPY